jgi:outer membrane protein TolC
MNANLKDCIRYALKNQPVLKQTILDEAITKQNTRIAISDWLPQFGANANIIHNFQPPVEIGVSNNMVIESEGLHNTSGASLYLNQMIYSNDLLLAGRTARYYHQKASQMTESEKIDLIVNVSKSYYDVMLTRQQLNLLVKEIERLARNLKDTYNQYQNGLTDRIDYKRASIALNNPETEKKYTEESLKAKYEYLKQTMGYPVEKNIVIAYDSVGMVSDMLIDTTQRLPYQNRIEFQILQTQLHLQQIMVSYYKMNFIPTLSAFGNYNFNYQSDQISQLYNKNYPNSLIGLSLSFPIFTGTKRYHYIKRAQLQYEQMALDSAVMKGQFNTEYVRALANYKTNLMSLKVMGENLDMARDIYKMVKEQYERGIKTYLEVIVAETDLRAAEINQLNALFNVVSAKLDVQRALGNVSLNY